MKPICIVIFLINLLFTSNVIAFSGVVYEVQNKLNEFGFNVGKVDGVFGQKTKAEILKFQKKYNLPPTGIIDSKLKETLKIKNYVIRKNPEEERRIASLLKEIRKHNPRLLKAYKIWKRNEKRDNLTYLLAFKSKYVDNNMENMENYLINSAEENYTPAQSFLGEVYLKGLYGISKSYALAKSWFDKAAKKGEVDALNGLGFMYENGLFVSVNYSKARMYYQKAADQGLAEAKFNLGALYFSGKGVIKNIQKAHKLFIQAAKSENVNAYINLGIMYYDGIGVTRNLDKSEEWFKKACEKEDYDGCYLLKKVKKALCIKAFGSHNSFLCD